MKDWRDPSIWQRAMPNRLYHGNACQAGYSNVFPFEKPHKGLDTYRERAAWHVVEPFDEEMYDASVARLPVGQYNSSIYRGPLSLCEECYERFIYKWPPELVALRELKQALGLDV